MGEESFDDHSPVIPASRVEGRRIAATRFSAAVVGLGVAGPNLAWANLRSVDALG